MIKTLKCKSIGEINVIVPGNYKAPNFLFTGHDYVDKKYYGIPHYY
tara:strand:+ start:117631 stop:117768 length:138 start_codon:yes stop_codon:yes gene_type:complete